MGIYSAPDQNSIQKQLDATLTAGATSLTLNEDISALLSKVSATNPIELVVDRVDSNGNVTPTKREYLTATTVSGAVLSGLTRNADGSGSDQEHAVGAIVEFVPGVLWAESIRANAISSDSTDTLTNKTIDADNNTISNIVIGAECTGASTALTDTADITYNADTDVSGNGWVLDEDDMSSDDATKVPTQQSVKSFAERLDDHRARAYVGTNQSLTANTEATVDFDTKSYDPNTNFNTTTKAYTAPATGGYLVNMVVRFAVNADSDRVFSYIRHNSTNVATMADTAYTDSFIYLELTCIVDATSGDTISGRVKNSSNNDTIEAGQYQSFIDIKRIW